MKTFKTMKQLLDHLYETKYVYCDRHIDGFDRAFETIVTFAVSEGQWEGLEKSPKAYNCFQDYRNMVKVRIREWRKANRMHDLAKPAAKPTLPSNTLSILNKPKRSSKDVHASIKRFERAQDNADGSASWDKIDLMANIEYYNKHGKLPSNVDMAKVMGKGMYNAQRPRGRR